jgi:integrase
MGTVHPLPARSAVTLGGAVSGYLRTLDHPEKRGTARVYGGVYRALAASLGEDTPLGTVTAGMLGAWFARQWGDAKPATWDTRRGALLSLLNYCERQDWITSAAGLIKGIERRKAVPDRSRALPAGEIGRLIARDNVALREKTLWRMLYESAARSAEVLRLNVEDLDLVNHCAKVTRKGSAADTITWDSGTARLLVRLLKGRTSGPVFLTERKARADLGLHPADVDPDTGKARLSYTQAEQVFKAATRSMPGGPWTLHQLRHSRLTHFAEDGMNAPMLMTKSGHTSITTLARYARPSIGALQRWEAEHDTARRR